MDNKKSERPDGNEDGQKEQTESKQPHRFKKGNKHGNRWEPGESGNPKGRKPGPCLKSELRRQLAEGTALKDFVAACLEHASNGNSGYAKELWARMHGLETARLEVSGPDGEPIKGYLNITPDSWPKAPDGNGSDGNGNGGKDD